MTKSLFEIGDDLNALAKLIEESDGDISDPAVEAAVTGWLNELAQDQALKADRYINLMRRWEMEQSAAKAESEQYAKRASVRKHRVERLKAMLKLYMEKTSQKKIETATGRTIAIQNNSGVAPLEIRDGVEAAKLPERFQKVTINFDTDSIRTALAAGEKLAFAQLGQRGTNLQIR